MQEKGWLLFASSKMVLKTFLMGPTDSLMTEKATKWAARNYLAIPSSGEELIHQLCMYKSEDTFCIKDWK